jgi:hypothetical protein
MLTPFTGGCACGAIRCKCREPLLALNCHCRDCHGQWDCLPPSCGRGGGDGHQGAPQFYMVRAPGNTGSAAACPQCGSPCLVVLASDIVGVRVGKRTTPAVYRPDHGHFTVSARAVGLHELGLPKFWSV